jgi:hypothetical protein
MKKLVNLLKSYLTKSSPAVVTPTFKTEQFDKVKKSLLDQTAKDSCCGGNACKCHKEEPKAVTPKPKATPKATPKAKPATSAAKKSKPKGK